MSVGVLLRESAAALLGGVFSALLTGALLAVLGVDAAAIAFLCLVILLGAFLPALFRLAVRLRFYRDTQRMLDDLQDPYLLCELVEPPGFAEGDFLCQVLRRTGKSMADRVEDARRDAAEYRDYVERWVHEIKTPIASARLALENHPGPLAEQMEGELFRVEGYVEQALYYARSAAVDRDYLIRAVSLEQLVSGAVRRYARPLIAAGFRVDMQGLDATVYTDEKWIGFILGQLMANAVAYRGETPTLTFTQRMEDSAAVLCMTDNGAGIPAADLPRVFDKGFTGANGRRSGARSTGLGLYLCRRLCCQLGLGLALFSKEGAWTRAEITFPKGGYNLAR